MTVTSQIASNSVIYVIMGVCLGITVSVLVIESSEIILMDMYSVDENLGWREEIKTYIVEQNWTAVDDTFARKIAKSVKVTCIIIVAVHDFNKTHTVLQQTWTRRCDNVVYFCDVLPVLDNVVRINHEDNIDVFFSTAVLYNSLDYVYNNYFTDTDWFLKVVPKTYIIVENLKLFLSDKNPEEPVYYGGKFKEGETILPNDDAGFVMSKEALRRLAEDRGLYTECNKVKDDASVDIARCFESVGVKFDNSLDSMNRSRFNFISTEESASHDASNLSMDANNTTVTKGISSISPTAISLAPYNLDNLVALEYYFYHARKYGVVPQEFV